VSELLTVLLGVPLLALAAHRAYRIVGVDQITEPIRSRFIFRDGRVWEWVADLIGCPWCLGWWLSGVAAVAYIGALDLSWWWVLVLWPAVSDGVGFLGRLDVVLGKISD
jgi:hypothetical protein